MISTELESAVRAQIERWEAGERPDAAAALKELPQLREAKSLFLDLVLAEYSLRTSAGDAVDKAELLDRFPAYRQSIEKLLEVQDYLDRCPQYFDKASDRSARWPVSGDEFLGYEIVEPLGRGGMARVYLARELAVGKRFVVIKISRMGGGEAHTLGKLSHPGIVPIHSVQHDQPGDWTVICMPLVGVATAIDLLDAAFVSGAAPREAKVVARVARETRPLAEVPQGEWTSGELSKLTYAEAVATIGLQLAEGLVAAHAAGILHRDIKPSNILLAWTGRAMLLDFNLSTDEARRSEGLGGTLAYMAPESIASVLADRGASARRFDPRSDIYSLGAVLYELLTNQLPAKPAGAEKLPLDAFAPWLECKKTPPVALAKSGFVDRRLEAIVLKCLKYEPAERYATAEDLVAALRSYLQPRARLSRVLIRRRRAVLVAGLGLIGGGFGLAKYLGSRPSNLQLRYQQAIEEYDRGDFLQAAATFGECLTLQPGWPQAFFGRGQALRRANKLKEARSDYMALEPYDRAWTFAFVGYCNMRLGYFGDAAIDYSRAYKEGLRDSGFLMAYASSYVNNRAPNLAVKIYTEILESDANNVAALANRGMILALSVHGDSRLPDEQAFADVKRYNELATGGFEAPFCGAVVFGEAARNDVKYEDQAREYFAAALQKGLPKRLIDQYPKQLKRLLPYVEASALFATDSIDSNVRLNLPGNQAPPHTARWDSVAGCRQKWQLATRP